MNIKSILSYNPLTGIFVWIGGNKYNGYVGKRAGAKTAFGYRRIGISGSYYKEHRLAWLYMTGRFPTKEIDHKNGKRADNRWSNLRQATHSQNGMNKVRQSNNKSGHVGVCWKPRENKWAAFVIVDSKQKYSSHHTSLRAAVRARRIAAKRLHGEFMKGERT